MTIFNDWLSSTDQIKCILIEVQVFDGLSNQNLYFSSRPFKNSANIYNPILNGDSVTIVERMSLSGGSGTTIGDIELDNTDGSLDQYLYWVWAMRPCRVYFGDVRWNRSEFQLIFDGITEDIGSKDRDVLNITVKDKLQRLDVPMSETMLGGSTQNKDSLLPLIFGECFNITPLLIDPATLKYQVHDSEIESIIEVRDAGVPVGFVANVNAGVFTLNASPFYAVTCSAQGHFNGQNLLPYSEQFDHASWSKNTVTVTANNTISPEGTTTADKIEATGSDSHMGDSVAVLSSRVYTFSVWLKADIPTTLRIYAGNGNGSPGNTPNTVTVTTEWKRYSVTHTTSATTTIAFCQIGGGGHFTAGEVVYAWGAQLEVGDIPHSYAKTEGGPANIFLKNVAGIIRYLVMNYGNPDTKFSSTDIDKENLQEFEDQNPQLIGIYIDSSDTVLNVCQQIAASVGGQIVMSREGKLQLKKIDLTSSNQIEINKTDIIANSLKINQKIKVQGSFKIGFAKNYTIQESIDTRIPPSHKDLFAKEWLEVISLDETVKTNYKQLNEIERIDTLLLTETDAQGLSDYYLNLYSSPRFIYYLQVIPKFINIKLGQSVKLVSNRFGLNAGKDGQVVGISTNWGNGNTNLEVLI